MIAGEPVWALAMRFPAQGAWSEADYLAFEAEHPRIELNQGFLDVLPVPSLRHQRAMEALFLLFKAHARSTRGLARVAGCRLRLMPGRIREPDVLLLRAENRQHEHEEYWTRADLVVEVLSPGTENEVRDRITKRREYADAAIPEYWIVDPEAETILVLELAQGGYVERGPFVRGESFASPAHEGLSVDVASVFDGE